MKDDKTSLKISSTKESGPVVENGKKRTRPVRPASKLVVRLLPPTMTEEQFKMQVSPLPDLDYFYFVPADMSLAPNAYCRAYLNFIDQSDLLIFTEKFDGYVFVDGKGDEFPAVVEYAPFQRIPKIRPNRKKDPKMGTIEDHPAFIAFKEQMEAENLENKAAANTSKQHFFETSLLPETKEEVISTPLLEYIRNKRAERQKMRDEKREEKRKKDLERRKTKEEQKKVKKDEDSVVVKRTQCCFSKPPKPNPSHHSMDALEVLSDKSYDKEKYKMHFGDTVSDNKSYLSVIKAVDEQEISQQVYELVNLFSTSGNGLNNDETRDDNLSIKNCIRHSDIEKEMLKNVRYKNQTHLTNNKRCNDSFLASNNGMFKFTESSSHFSGSKSVKFASNFGVRDNMLTKPLRHSNYESTKHSRTTASELKSHSEMFSYKEPKVNLHKHFKHDIKNSLSNYENSAHTEINRKFSSDNFSEEVFRKNLEKVVADVLGKSKVNSPRKNIISKPKTFVKRVIDGSGEQCTRAGFNSPSFYLPPRAFGCGPSQPMKDTSSSENCLSLAHSQRSLKIVPEGIEHDTFSRTLPPFWSKPIISSKSDGDIETYESSKKVGGSQENLKRKIEISACGIKPFARRPHVARKKSLYIDTNGKGFF